MRGVLANQWAFSGPYQRLPFHSYVIEWGARNIAKEITRKSI